MTWTPPSCWLATKPDAWTPRCPERCAPVSAGCQRPTRQRITGGEQLTCCQLPEKTHRIMRDGRQKLG